MGHSKLNLLVVIAGFFTLGAAFGAFEPKAEARIEVAPVVIIAGPISACTEFELHDDGTAFCWDNGEYYDLDHYMVESDTDGEGFYLGVWE
jgi:hypothetical protein